MANITAAEVRRLLRDPCVLNLVCGLAALHRVYEGIDPKGISYIGHFVPISLYVIGFLAGIPSPRRDDATSTWSAVSYVFLVLGSISLLIVVFCDAVTAAAKRPEGPMGETTIVDGIVIGACGGAFAGVTVWTVQLIHTKITEARHKTRLYEWLRAHTSDEEGNRFRSTRAIASWNNLPEDRVRYVCSIHEKIFLSTGEKEDLWGLDETRARTQ